MNTFTEKIVFCQKSRLLVDTFTEACFLPGNTELKM